MSSELSYNLFDVDGAIKGQINKTVIAVIIRQPRALNSARFNGQENVFHCRLHFQLKDRIGDIHNENSAFTDISQFQLNFPYFEAYLFKNLNRIKYDIQRCYFMIKKQPGQAIKEKVIF